MKGKVKKVMIFNEAFLNKGYYEGLFEEDFFWKKNWRLDYPLREIIGLLKLIYLFIIKFKATYLFVIIKMSVKCKKCDMVK